MSSFRMCSHSHTRVEVNPLRGEVEVEILLDGGIRMVEWSEYRDYFSLGIATQRSAARSIGRLIDYIGAVDGTAASSVPRQVFYRRFLTLLRFGSLADGDDDLHLWWFPASTESVLRCNRELTLFGDWLVERYGREPLNPQRIATQQEQIRFWVRWNKQSSTSILKHLRSPDLAMKWAGLARIAQPPRAAACQQSVKRFPDDRFEDLLWKGFGGRSANDWTVVRDQLMALLLHGGGLRLSEALHAWVHDVYDDPADPSVALVRIYHPRDGIVAYRDPGSGRQIRTTRSEYLRVRYNRMPLTDLPGRQCVGWKNPLLQDKQDLYLVVFWRHPDFGRTFKALYRKYVASRPRVSDHPYLFISGTGSPQTEKGYEKVHAAAVRRIGLVPAKHLGTTPHGHRHSFGQYLTDKKVSAKVIQIVLHHRSLVSQDVYTEPDITKVQAELARVRHADGNESAL